MRDHAEFIDPPNPDAWGKLRQRKLNGAPRLARAVLGQALSSLLDQVDCLLHAVDQPLGCLAVEDALAALCRYHGLDRAYVLKARGTDIELFVEWWSDGIDHLNTPIAQLPIEAQRFWARTVRGRVPVHIPDVTRDCPPGAEEAMRVLARDGVKSILFVPLRARDEPVGFILCVPDINVAFRKINGRLTTYGIPVGLAKLLYHKSRIHTARAITVTGLSLKTIPSGKYSNFVASTA